MGSHILDYGADPYDMGADIEIEIDANGRPTGRHRRRPQPAQHRLPPAPPGWASLRPGTKLEINQAMQSAQGRASLRALMNQLDNKPPRFRGDEDGYGDDSIGDEIGAELDEIGAEAAAAVIQGNVGQINALVSRLETLERALSEVVKAQRLSAPKVVAMYRRHTAIMKHLAWSSTRGLSVAAGAAAGGRGIPQIGIDYEATPAGTDQEFPFIDVATGSSLITTVFGTPTAVSFVAPFGTEIQIQNLRWKPYSGTATGIQCTALTVDQAPLLYNLDGEGADMSGWTDSDPGKRPGLRTNPKMVPGNNKITGTFEAIGAAGQSMVWKLFVTARVLRDSTLGQRQRPVGV